MMSTPDTKAKEGNCAGNKPAPAPKASEGEGKDAAGK
jgi:hypothetical protein